MVRWLGLLLACASACFSEENSQSSSASADATSDGGSTHGGTHANDVSTGIEPSECGASAICIPPIPVEGGWAGPVALDRGPPGTLASCVGAYDDTAWEGLGTGIAAMGSCTCDCAGMVQIACTNAVIETFTEAGCSGASLSVGAGLLICTELDAGAQSVRVTMPVEQVTCPEPTAIAQLGPATLSESVRACGGDVLGAACSTGVCAARPMQPFAPGPCIWQAGDVPCPAGYDAGERVLTYQGIADTRSCVGACACEGPATCNGTVAGGNDDACSLQLGNIDECIAVSNPEFVSASSFGGDPNQCSPTAANAPPTGAATGTDPVTFCCT